MDLAIIMGRKDHFKEVMEWSKGMKKNTPERRSSWSRLKSDMRNMPTKYENMLSLRLDNTCG
jgi:hypothetical protein